MSCLCLSWHFFVLRWNKKNFHLKNGANMEEKNYIPILPLRRIVIFPGQVTKLTLARTKSIATAKASMETNRQILLVPQLNPDAKNNKPVVYHNVGVLATIFELSNSNGVVEVYLTGQRRVYVENILSKEDHDEAMFSEFILTDNETVESEVYFDQLLQIVLNKEKLKTTSLGNANFEINPNKVTKNELIDELATYFPYNIAFDLLNDSSTTSRLEKSLMFLTKEIKTSELEQSIQEKVRKNFEKGQKETYLRETMSVIQKELGIGEEQEELRAKIFNLPLDESSKEKLLKDVDKCAKMSPSSAEFTLLTNYLEFVLDLPWGIKTEDSCDLKKAKEILDKEHFGLDKIKDRILEFLAVHHLTDSNRDPILCFVGPPGVGKTTIVRSIADALGRKYVRMSLGGVHDEAEIRGHRKTYIGAMAGRILSGIKQGGSSNPVFLLDEIDKLAKDFRGDPSAALLEVLDPELNWTFRDNYLELPFDLSDVTFVTTANSLESIPPALADRMEIIEMSGYTPVEKLEIAKKHLVPKQLHFNGLTENQVKLDDEILKIIIQNYTREAGVRQLEKQIAKVMRCVARNIVEGKTEFQIIDEDKLSEFLGVAHVGGISKYDENQIGAVMGLAWTQFGGEILPIEVSTMKGKGEILLTGKLGDVLKESARTAISFLRSNETMLGLEENWFEKLDIHIHIPEGAVPKDGPSAGVTLATAVYSAIGKKEARADLAMTGEITLRGKVLPIGGLKEKLMAAQRAGIYEIVAPFGNQKDMAEIPQSVKNDVKVHFAKELKEVFEIAFKK